MYNYIFSSRSLARMVGVDQRIINVAERALEITPIDFGIPEHGGKRTPEEQYNLFAVGLSNADGYKKKSRHQYGLALDVYAYVDGKASWHIDHLTTVAAAMLQAANELSVKLQWAGHWTTFKDYPHFQTMYDKNLTT